VALQQVFDLPVLCEVTSTTVRGDVTIRGEAA
jgi:hypothetical protein